MDFFNDIFHNLALLEFYFLNIIYILLYIDFILSIFFQHSNILTRASHHWCLASNIVLVSIEFTIYFHSGHSCHIWFSLLTVYLSQIVSDLSNSVMPSTFLFIEFWHITFFKNFLNVITPGSTSGVHVVPFKDLSIQSVRGHLQQTDPVPNHRSLLSRVTWYPVHISIHHGQRRTLADTQERAHRSMLYDIHAISFPSSPNFASIIHDRTDHRFKQFGICLVVKTVVSEIFI